MLHKTLGDDLAKIGTTVQRIGQVHNVMSKLYTSLEEGQMADLHETTGESFEKIHQSVTEMRKIVFTDFNKFFRYYKNELSSIEELLMRCDARKSSLVKAEKKLKERKDALFAQHTIEKWGILPSCKEPVDTLLNNKVIAFREMLPTETAEAHKMRIHYGYYANKVLEEYMRINKKNSEEIKEHLLKTAKKNCNIFEDINVMWADMVAHFANIVDKVDNSDEKIVKAHAELPKNMFEKKKEDN